MKKGFTLVELIAVIIVLAIVALLATPVVIDVINDSRESANLRSIEGYARAIKQEYYNQSMDGGTPTIDETFLSNVETGGGSIVCEDILYNPDNGVIMYKCKFDNNDKEYCYANDNHYACDDEIFLGIYTGQGGGTSDSKSLIDTLLEQYQEGNEVGLVKDETNPNLYYYTGTNEEVANNFLWYGGHQWRILEFDTEAKTLTLITQQPLTAIQPASSIWTTKEEYESSYIKTWLNDYFWNSLNSSIQNNILASTFNIGIYTDVDEITTTQKVGLLDEDQYKRAGEADSFLDIKDYFWLGNRHSSSYVRHVNHIGNLNGSGPSGSYGVRAVIKISDITIIEDSDGTIASSYRIANKATNTNNVQVGEYINVPYSGSDNACGDDNMCTFRVVSKDNDSIKVALNGLLPTTSQWADNANYNITTNDLIYTNVLNGFIENIDSKYITMGTYGVGMYESGNSYAVPQSTTITASIGLPTVGEMFSGNDIEVTTGSKIFVDVNTIENPFVSAYYWTMNRYSSSYVRDVYSNGTLSYSNPPLSHGIRAVIYLKSGTSTITFSTGEGTPNSPYVLQ